MFKLQISCVMKKLYTLLVLVAVCSVLSSCKKDNNNESNNDNSYSEEFVGKWFFIDDEPGYGPINNSFNYVLDFDYQYASLSSEYYTYLCQGNFERVQELREEMNEMKEYSKNAHMGGTTVVEITANAIKIGDADVYLNATSAQNLWASGYVWGLNDYSSGSHVYDPDFFKMCVCVEDWRTYHYTIEDGVLFFDNGERMIVDDDLYWADYGTFRSVDQLLQNLYGGKN